MNPQRRCRLFSWIHHKGRGGRTRVILVYHRGRGGKSHACTHWRHCQSHACLRDDMATPNMPTCKIHLHCNKHTSHAQDTPSLQQAYITATRIHHTVWVPTIVTVPVLVRFFRTVRLYYYRMHSLWANQLPIVDKAFLPAFLFFADSFFARASENSLIPYSSTPYIFYCYYYYDY